MTSQFPQARPRRLRRSPELRGLFQESEFTLNDLVLPIFVEEEIDDFVPITSMIVASGGRVIVADIPPFDTSTAWTRPPLPLPLPP